MRVVNEELKGLDKTDATLTLHLAFEAVAVPISSPRDYLCNSPAHTNRLIARSNSHQFQQSTLLPTDAPVLDDSTGFLHIDRKSTRRERLQTNEQTDGKKTSNPACRLCSARKSSRAPDVYTASFPLVTPFFPFPVIPS